MADNYMTYNDAIDVLTPYAEKINTIKPEPITWAAYQLLTTAQKEAKRYIITDYPSPTGYVNELADLEDVDINTSILVDGQMLVYNSTTQKWENKTILEDSLTSTATDKALSANQGRVLKDNIDDNFSGQSNENLLDNPFFTVNQRGVTGAISTLGAYVSSRWRLTALATATVVGNTITLSTGAQISQQLKTGLVSGKTYTLSIKLSNGDIEHATGTYNGEVAKVFLDNANFEAGYVSADYDLYVYAKSEKTITAVKLELGSISTLANDVAPDYALELAKCQTSTATPSDTYANQGQLMTSALQGVYGAKNLNSYPYYETTKNQNGITFTDNGDGTVKVGDSTAQTATDYVFFYMHDRNNEDFILPDGDYKINGCPAGGVLNTTYQLIIAYKDSNNITVEAVDVGDGATIHIENSLQGKDKTKVTFAIIVFGNYTVPAGGITFKPMIRDARILDPNYAPPAKTNQQLTADKAERADLATLNLTGSTNTTGTTIKSGTFFYLNGSYCKAKTNIANGATFTLNTNFEVVSVGGELANMAFHKIAENGTYSTVTADTWEYTGVSFTIPAKTFYGLRGESGWQNGRPTGLAISVANDALRTYECLTLYEDANGAAYCSATGYSAANLTVYLWSKRQGTGSNPYTLNGWYVNE